MSPSVAPGYMPRAVSVSSSRETPSVESSNCPTSTQIPSPGSRALRGLKRPPGKPPAAPPAKRQAKQKRPTGHISTLDKLRSKDNGDVAIILDTELPMYQFFIEKSMLTSNSAWFTKEFDAADLDDIPALENSSVGINYLFILQTDSEEYPTLVRKSTEVLKKIEERSQATVSEPSSLQPQIKSEPSDTNNQQFQRVLMNEDMLTAYVDLFLAFINRPPSYGNGPINDTLDMSMTLIKLANQYECMHLIRSHLGHCFQQYRQTLFHAIYTKPVTWLNLAIDLQDTSMCTEALIHIVGSYPSEPWKELLEGNTDPYLLQLVQRKAIQLEKQCESVVRCLLQNLLHTYDGDEPQELDMSNDFEAWLLVQIFRDWLATKLPQYLKAAKLKDGSVIKQLDLPKIGSLFRAVHRGGDAYLPVIKVVQMLKKVGTRTNHYEWEDSATDLELLKEHAHMLTEEVCKNRLMLSLDDLDGDLDYLTCVEILPEEMPWVQGQDVKSEAAE